MKSLLVFLLLSTAAVAQTVQDSRPLVEQAPVVGRGDYVWLLPIIALFIAVSGWYIWRRRNARH